MQRSEPVLSHIGVDQVKEIAQLAKEARDAQDKLLNKMRVVDRVEDGRELTDQAVETLDTLDASLDNRTLADLKQQIAGLSDDARHELMALMWVGAGEFVAAQWDDALTRAQSESDAGDVDFLAEKGELHDFLAKGLFKLGVA
ncbi:MAG TPA: DUF3775 domain-containing protein [Stellaceae bacterium]|jgi:hypothetical protein